MLTRIALFQKRQFILKILGMMDSLIGGNAMGTILKLTKYLGRLMAGTTGRMVLTGLLNSLYVESSHNLLLIWNTGREGLLTTIKHTKSQMMV
jgi:hypothetical protein